MAAAARPRVCRTSEVPRPAPGARRRASLALAALVTLGALPASAVDAQSPEAPAEGPAERPCHLVADGRRVRARTRAAQDTRTTLVGTALGWGTPAPRLITATGDTLPLDATHRVWVSAGRTGRRAAQGALMGWLAGVVVTVADCGLAASCGEQNPVPLLGGIIGGVVGQRFRTERWTRVPAVTSSTCAAAPP